MKIPHPGLAQWLSEQGHDAVHVVNLGCNGRQNFDIVAQAQREMRTVVTADLDYPGLLALAQTTEPSLILSDMAIGANRCRRKAVGGACRVESAGHSPEHPGGGSRSRTPEAATDHLIA